VVGRDLALIALAGTLLRLPFVSHVLWGWDSVLYARAVDRFDPAAMSPHPPGYLVYVLLARFSATVFGDPNSGLVALSVVGGAALACAGYIAARHVAGQAAGIAAAAILIVSPLVWHQSEIAYPYTILGALAGWLLVGVLLLRPRAFVLASLGFGIALGIRPDLSVIAGPLWAAAALPRGARHVAMVLAAGAAGALLWFVPTAMAAGGVDRYLDLVWNQAVGSSGITHGLGAAIERNAGLLQIGLLWQLLWLWPLAAAGAVRVVREPALRALRLPLLLASAPALCMYLFFHIGEPAYTLSLAAPIAILTALGVTALPRLAPRRARPLAASASAVLVLALAVPFVFGGDYFSAPAIAQQDETTARRIDYIRAHYDPRETVIVARGNYQHARFYLPEYTAVRPTGRGRAARERFASAVASARKVVFLDGCWRRLDPTADRVVLAPGVQLWVSTGSQFVHELAVRDVVDLEVD
jgi:4-amino-4-deoxy-L-arabinose transferase-like glycosyltransferase